MLSIVSWNFSLASNVLVCGVRIGSKLAAILTRKDQGHRPNGLDSIWKLDNEMIISHLGLDMLFIHLVLVGYTYIEWIYAKITNISTMCTQGKK